MNAYDGTRRERARLNILQALQDLGAHSQGTATGTKDVDHIVGELSRYAAASNKTIMQTLLRDNLIKIDFSVSALRIWLTPHGRNYLDNED